MSDYDSNRIIRGHAAEASAVDAGLRSYMLRVYNYMLMALVVTGIVAYGLYSAAVTSDPGSAAATLKNGMMLTSLGVTLFVSPLKYILMFAPLGVVLMINARIRSMSFGGAQTWFWIYSALVGASLSVIFLIFVMSSIFQVFFITAAAFGGLSLYGYTTKRDLSPIGSFLIMGVWGLIIASVVSLFLRSDMLSWIISVAGVAIFAGLTAWNTQTIKEMYFEGDSGEIAGKKAVWGALALYIDFVAMFQYLLMLVGNRR
jgi:FtsH-binding integral membrane protein